MNYIGSKYSLLDFLHSTIADVTGYKDGDQYIFADLFAGTGVVGASYRKRGCMVISNDIQYYSYVLNKYMIENISPNDTTLLRYLNELPGIEGFVYNNYCAGSGSGRNYFTDDNGKKCDAIRTELENLHESNKISDETYFYYLASLINSIDKYANTASFISYTFILNVILFGQLNNSINIKSEFKTISVSMNLKLSNADAAVLQCVLVTFP